MTEIPNRRGMSPAALRKRESIRRLKAAMAEDRLVVRYQPIVETATGRLVAAEALLGWRDADGVHDPLTGLIAAAERSPVIFALERWAIATAAADAAAWQEGPLRDVRLNVNLSAREFDRPRLLDRLRALVQRAGMAPGRVTLELTETSAIVAPSGAVTETLAALAREGFAIWLDDFGTGHSSLDWLRYLPIHGLKVPAVFTKALPGDRRSATIVAAVLDLAHALGLLVTAEGVEDEAQRAWLRDRGCEALQGFLFGAALDAARLVDRAAGTEATTGRP